MNVAAVVVAVEVVLSVVVAVEVVLAVEVTLLVSGKGRSTLGGARPGTGYTRSWSYHCTPPHYISFSVLLSRSGDPRCVSSARPQRVHGG